MKIADLRVDMRVHIQQVVCMGNAQKYGTVGTVRQLRPETKEALVWFDASKSERWINIRRLNQLREEGSGH